MKKQEQSRLLQIAQLGQKILRDTAKPVVHVKSTEIRSLIGDLKATLFETGGVGIAAPQVYRSVRLFIVASHPTPRYPLAPTMRPTAVINPSIESYGKETEKDWEGCLSIPGVRALVPRPTTISVSFVTENGKRVKRTYTGFIARIFQHEYDHLEGKVFLDRIETTNDIISDKEYLRLTASKT